jgi:hypothetical protein
MYRYIDTDFVVFKYDAFLFQFFSLGGAAAKGIA